MFGVTLDSVGFEFTCRANRIAYPCNMSAFEFTRHVNLIVCNYVAHSICVILYFPEASVKERFAYLGHCRMQNATNLWGAKLVSGLLYIETSHDRHIGDFHSKHTPHFMEVNHLTL